MDGSVVLLIEHPYQLRATVRPIGPGEEKP